MEQTVASTDCSRDTDFTIQNSTLDWIITPSNLNINNVTVTYSASSK